MPAGSTVGAGILALPAVTAPAGFLPSAATMVAVWALLAAESLLLAEVNLAIRAQQVRGPCNLLHPSGLGQPCVDHIQLTS